MKKPLLGKSSRADDNFDDNPSEGVNVVAVALPKKPLNELVAASLGRLGYLQEGADDEALLDALSAFIRTENFEEREQERGYLDRAVIAFMKENPQV